MASLLELGAKDTYVEGWPNSEFVFHLKTELNYPTFSQVHFSCFLCFSPPIFHSDGLGWVKNYATEPLLFVSYRENLKLLLGFLHVTNVPKSWKFWEVNVAISSLICTQYTPSQSLYSDQSKNTPSKQKL